MAYVTKNEKPVFSVADEGRALRNLMWMWWITAVTYNAVAIPVIWDPAQHSFLVRDSTWTPPHLMIFGPFFALMMFEAIVFQFYALKKAQPYIRGDIPITLWVFPITVFGFTLGSMLTNEIGHIFLFREEFFSMPTHWNFVLTFMFIYAVGVPEVTLLLWNRKLDSFEAITTHETRPRALRPEEDAVRAPTTRWPWECGPWCCPPGWWPPWRPCPAR